MKIHKTKIAAILMTAGLILSGFNLLAEEEGPRLQYKVGDGLSIGDGNNLVHFQGRVQGRLTYSILEGTADTATFSVPRAEFRIDGFTLGKKLKYGFEMNLATRARATTTSVCTNAGCTTTANAVTAESTSGLASLNDYYIDWVPTSYFGVQTGQFKVPYLIQQLTSITKQQFVDRSLSTGFFDLGRDIGVNLHGAVLEDKLKYALFVMNGDGANSLNRNSRSMLVGGRLEVPILGTYEYSETDVGQSPDHNLGVGIGYAFNENGSASQSGTIAGFTKTQNGTLDVGYKHNGISFQGAGMITRASEVAKLTNWGYNTQLGYFLIPKTLEVATRAGGAVFSNATVNQYEYAAVLNYFPMSKGHGVKFQTDYTLLMNSGGVQNINDHRIRTAMNLIF